MFLNCYAIWIEGTDAIIRNINLSPIEQISLTKHKHRKFIGGFFVRGIPNGFVQRTMYLNDMETYNIGECIYVNGQFNGRANIDICKNVYCEYDNDKQNGIMLVNGTISFFANNKEIGYSNKDDMEIVVVNGISIADTSPLVDSIYDDNIVRETGYIDGFMRFIHHNGNVDISGKTYKVNI